MNDRAVNVAGGAHGALVATGSSGGTVLTSAPRGASPVLKVTDLSVEIGSEPPRAVVSGVSYSLFSGRTLAIIGESGSGKTMSARGVMGLLPPGARVTGSIELDGEELAGRSARELRRYRGPGFAMVFQDPHRSLNPTMRVGDQVGESLKIHYSLTRRQVADRVAELLRMVRLPAPDQRAAQYPHQLSGGMRQRVMLAIALACRPKVLFADEATSALDVTTQAKIMELLADLQSELQMAVVMISHNLGLAANYADDVLVIYDGRTVGQGPVAEVFENVQMPYTQLLLDSVPSVDRVVPLQVRPTDPTVAAHETGGCAFAPRCPRVAERCTAERPLLAPTSGAHRWACWHPLGNAERRCDREDQ